MTDNCGLHRNPELIYPPHVWVSEYLVSKSAVQRTDSLHPKEHRGSSPRKLLLGVVPRSAT